MTGQLITLKYHQLFLILFLTFSFLSAAYDELGDLLDTALKWALMQIISYGKKKKHPD